MSNGSRSLLTPFRVGLVALAGLAAFTFLVIKVSVDTDRKDGYKVHAFLNDGSGLVVNTGVRIAGIDVGRISAIELIGEQAKVTLRVTVPLYSDASLIRRQGSILGDHYLQLVPGSTLPMLQEGSEISRVVTDTGPAAIMTSLEQVSADIGVVVASLKEVLGGDKGQEALAAIVNNLTTSTAAFQDVITGNAEKFDRIIANIDVIARDIKGMTGNSTVQVEQILAEVHLAVAEINSLVGNTKGDVAESMGTLKGTMVSLQEALDRANASLANLNTITNKVEAGEGVVGGLLSDRKLLTDTENLVDDVGELVGGLSRVQTVVGARSEYNLMQNSLKNYFTLRLQPRRDKYYLIELIDDPRGSTDVIQRTVRSTDPNQPALVREEVSETSDALKLSLQYAKKYRFLTGRFGVIEGTGGVGFNADFFDDRLGLRADLFNFGGDLNPRFKWALSYELLKNVHLLGGMDDSFNQQTRDYFFGAGLSFTDEDLKSLLMVVKPSAP